MSMSHNLNAKFIHHQRFEHASHLCILQMSKLGIYTGIPKPILKLALHNIYPYFPCYCANGGPQVKGIYFDQYPYTVLAAPTIQMIVSIAATYCLTIIIVDVMNSFRNNLKTSSEGKLLTFHPTNYPGSSSASLPSIYNMPPI